MDPDVEAQRTSDRDSELRSRASKSGSMNNSHRVPIADDIAQDAIAARSSHDEERLSGVASGAGRSSDDTPPASASSNASSGSSSSSGSSVEDDNEGIGLFKFEKALRTEPTPGEPWYMEMTRLRRMYFLYLNKRLAQCRKRILTRTMATDDDMDELKGLLRDQGKFLGCNIELSIYLSHPPTSADAIRDFQYILSLDILSAGQMDKRRDQCELFFPKTAKSDFKDVFPFDTENYRCLPRASKTALEPFSDEIRDFLRAYLPVQLSWTTAERETSPDLYRDRYRPKTLSKGGERIARFLVAIAGALFILVPMYIMALHESRTKNLLTTTIAVVLFALLCSLTLRTSNDQTLGATAGYAAVLTVFVGLTSVTPKSGS